MDRQDTLDMLAGRGVAAARLEALEEGVKDVLNGPYYAIQVAIGQDDGGIASLYVSGRDDDLATALAGRIVAAGWDGASVPKWREADHGRLLADGETREPNELEPGLVAKAVSDFLASLGDQAGLDAAQPFDADDREMLTDHFAGYLAFEADYRQGMAPN